MKNLLAIALLTLCATPSVFAYKFSVNNATAGSLFVKFNLTGAVDHDVKVEPGKVYTYESGGKCLKQIEVWGLTDPISPLGAIKKPSGNPCWGKAFKVEHVGFKVVDPENINTITNFSGGEVNPSLAIYPSTGSLVIKQIGEKGA